MSFTDFDKINMLLLAIVETQIICYAKVRKLKGGENLTHRILKQIKQFPNANTEFLEHLFQSELDKFMDEGDIIHVKEGIRFITSREKITKVWILITGDVNVIEEYRSGTAYIFQENHTPSVFGEMELIANMDFFMASLIAKTDCLLVTIPVKSYLNHIKSNSALLFERAGLNLRVLLEGERDNRIYLQLQSIDRMKLYFIKRYDVNGAKEDCILKIPYQQIADATGYSVKTVLRSVNKLKEQGHVSAEGQKIRITKEQYKKMLHSIQEITGH